MTFCKAKAIDFQNCYLFGNGCFCGKLRGREAQRPSYKPFAGSKTKRAQRRKSPNEPSKKYSNNSETIGTQSNKLLALYFIKVLCLSATALQSRPKQKAKSTILRFYFLDDFLLSRDLQVDVHLRKIDQISAALSVNFVWGARPQSPYYFEGGVSRPFKTKIQTAPDDIFLLTFARCYTWCLHILSFRVSFKLNIV